MATDSGTYTDDTLARKRRIAEALMGNSMMPQKIEHWTQGLAQLARAGIGGYLGNQADQEGREQEKGLNEAYLGFLGGGAPSSPTASPVAAALTGNTPPNKIYENDEPSPLDPPSGPDRDAVIRTMIAEAGNQGPQGLNAVGSVIRNRAVNGGFGGDTPSGVVQAPNQFEPWNTSAGRSRMAAIDPNGQQYSAAAQALDSAYAGNDPTGGATHFFAPKAQAALGRQPPAWGQSGGQDIGDHRFFGGKPPQTQLAGDMPQPDPAALPPNAQPTQGQSPVASALSGPSAQIRQMLQSNNPKIRQMGRSLAQGIVAQQFKPQDYDFKERPDGTLVAVNKKNPRDVQVVQAPGGGQDAVKFEADKAGAVARAKAVAEREVGGTPAQISIDKKFGDDYAEFVAGGGYADTEKQLSQLSSVLNDLKAGKNYSGPIVGMTPDVIAAFTNPEAIAARERVEEVAQRNLRLILGGQFAMKEGEQLIKRAFNPSLKPQENARRVSLLIEQMTEVGQQKARAAEHFEKNGTLAGFKGQVPNFNSFRNKMESVWADNNPNATGTKPPQPGHVEGGYRFKGGNPADQKSWEPVR